MRYLGNKESILTEISDLLESQGLLKDGFTFFDAFCGSAGKDDFVGAACIDELADSFAAGFV